VSTTSKSAASIERDSSRSYPSRRRRIERELVLDGMSGAILSLVMGQVAPGISVATPLQRGKIAEDASRMMTALNRGGMGKTGPLRSRRDDEGKGEAESSRRSHLRLPRF